MFWHDTQCIDGIVDCLKRYRLVRGGKWLDWKGTRGMVWVGRYLICGK
jgi:hypothetical protein